MPEGNSGSSFTLIRHLNDKKAQIPKKFINILCTKFYCALIEVNIMSYLLQKVCGYFELYPILWGFGFMLITRVFHIKKSQKSYKTYIFMQQTFLLKELYLKSGMSTAKKCGQTI
jgi:hypothetical protein